MKESSPWADVTEAARHERICRWVSTNGIDFTSEGPACVVDEMPGKSPFADADVFKDPATDWYYLLIRGSDELCNKTSIGLYRSKDIDRWERISTSFKPQGSGMCCHLFEWNGWYYMISGPNTDRRQKARSMDGPWEYMANGGLLDGLMVPKTAAFAGNRYLLVGNTAPWRGGVVVIRELVQLPNGDLGMKFVPELIPETKPPVKLSVIKLRGEVSHEGARVSIASTRSDSVALGYVQGMDQDLRITARVVPGPGTEAYGLCVRAQGNYESGAEVRLEPVAGTVQFGVPKDGALASANKKHPPQWDSWGDDGGSVAGKWGIGNVPGLYGPITIDVIVTRGWVDVCIDGQRTMITRCAGSGDRIFCFARNGKVVFENLEIRPLAGSAGVTGESTSNRPIKSGEKK